MQVNYEFHGPLDRRSGGRRSIDEYKRGRATARTISGRA